MTQQPSTISSGTDLAVDLIDTADSYGPSVSEGLIREALHPCEGLVVPPIPGTGRFDHLEENVTASAPQLGDDDVGTLDAAGAAAWDEANGR